VIINSNVVIAGVIESFCVEKHAHLDIFDECQTFSLNPLKTLFYQR